ncbi:MAG: hypothetical protein HQK96_07140 [Nitrospirae bacterium]|nr:hypothetical protein [Nitrospirota bacterium]
MDEITYYTLLTDGRSDRVLIPILECLLDEYSSNMPVKIKWADLSNMPKQKKLEKRIEMAMKFYPCKILFIHRDAEKIPHKERVQEIHKAIEKIPNIPPGLTTICVVPVRMTEAWLLIDGAAIRKAADNPNGDVDLKLPKSKELETIPDPKDVLSQLLIEASGCTGGRKLDKFKEDISEKAFKVAENIEDFSPLRSLLAFQALEEELKTVLSELNL